MATIKTCINTTLQNTKKDEGNNKNIVVKTLRYYRLEKKDNKGNPQANNAQVPAANLFQKGAKVVKLPDAVIKYDLSLVFSYANALIGKILASLFPWGKEKIYRVVYRDYIVVSDATYNYNDDRQLARMLRYVSLPPGRYRQILEPETGFKAFQSWYKVYAQPLQDPTSRWYVVQEELNNNFMNYIDPQTTNATDSLLGINNKYVQNILKQVQKLAQAK